MSSLRSQASRARAAGRLSAVHRRLTYLVCALLYITGALWLLFHYAVAAPDELGRARHPLESWSLRLHGAVAFGFLVALGSLLPRHIGEAWATRRNRSSGAIMLSAASLLVITGWGLYYVGGETLREWLSIGHWVIGLAAAPLLLFHVLLGWRQKPRVEAAPCATEALRNRAGFAADRPARAGRRYPFG